MIQQIKENVSSYYNHRVFKYTLSNGSYTQSTVAGTGNSGSALNQLNYAKLMKNVTTWQFSSGNHLVLTNGTVVEMLDRFLD